MSPGGGSEAARIFGANVRRRRLALGLMQYELAEIIGYAAANLSRIELGGTNPTLSSMLVLAEALDTTVSRLLRGV